jgi:hypothetical protein
MYHYNLMQHIIYIVYLTQEASLTTLNCFDVADPCGVAKNSKGDNSLPRHHNDHHDHHTTSRTARNDKKNIKPDAGVEPATLRLDGSIAF